MRVFQIEIPAIDTLEWIVGKEEYEKQYGERRAAALVEAAAREFKIASLGIHVLPEKAAPILVTATQLIELNLAGTEYKLVRELKGGADDPISPNSFMEQFSLMAEKLLSLPGLHQSNPTHDDYNHRCEVHMPGQALATYNETLLLENVCTDALQDTMDKGWRIIAACPQPGARRPDYILGRFNPERDVNTGARRDA